MLSATGRRGDVVFLWLCLLDVETAVHELPSGSGVYLGDSK